MATSKRETQPNARINRNNRNMSPLLKATEPDQGPRRASRSVPSSPEHVPSQGSSSSNAGRPSSAISARATSSRSAISSTSSSTHGKTLQSTSSTATAKQVNTTRKKVDKPGPASVWPPALASKDTTRAAKSSSTMQKSKLSTRTGVEKLAVSSLNLRAQKAMPGALGAGKTQSVSSMVRTSSSVVKRRMGAVNSANPNNSIQRTKSVPARQMQAPKVEEEEVDLLMEFDEMESISTPSIEEHLQQRLPDPIELEPMDALTYAISEDAQSEACSNQGEYRNEEVLEYISGHKHQGNGEHDLVGGENADVGINNEVNVKKEYDKETELNEVRDETKVNEPASGIEIKEYVDGITLNKAITGTELERGVNEVELKDDIQVDSTTKEEAKVKEGIILPTKTQEFAQSGKKDEGRSNDVIENRSKQERKNKVMALVGKFETVMSTRE